MSETRRLNPQDDSSNDVEQLLRGLAPEPLEVSHDELFFRAGYAAGARGRSVRWFWPSAVAALVVVCVSLGAALQRQASALQTALAAAGRSSEIGELAIVGDDRAKSQATDDVHKESIDAVAVAPEVTTDSPNSVVAKRRRDDSQFASVGFYDDRLRNWQRIASADFVGAGRLTARGWIETPPDFRDRLPENTDEREPALRPRPSTYLELRQLHLEG